jgi:hypothetical protein
MRSLSASRGGARRVPHGRLGQLVERGGFDARFVASDACAWSAFVQVFLDLQQRVELQGAAHLHLQLQAVELQQPDRLQQLRCQVYLLAKLGVEQCLHGASPCGRRSP